MSYLENLIVPFGLYIEPTNKDQKNHTEKTNELLNWEKLDNKIFGGVKIVKSKLLPPKNKSLKSSNNSDKKKTRKNYFL